jgi:hypothetical protein
MPAPTVRPMRLTSPLCMRQETMQATHFSLDPCSQCKGPVNCASASHFAWVGPTAYACSSCSSAGTLLPHRALLLLLPRLPARPHPTCCFGTPRPLRFPCARGDRYALRGPPPSTPTSCVWSCNTCNINHLMQHTSETDETFTKHLLATYVYSHCNIQIKHLQHTFETAETFETYTCNIHI